MLVRHIDLFHYRNIKETSLSLSPGVNVLFGDNGQGKTNLLESIYLFSAGRSFRAGRDRDFISYEEEMARVSMEFEGAGRLQSGEMRLFSDKRKEIRLGGIPIKKIAELMGVFSSILFAPEHLDIVKEGPSGRRRFLDFALSQLEPRYYSALSALSRILIQKNALLKEARKTGKIPDTLPIWNEKLAAAAALITIRRAAYTERLSLLAAERLFDLSGGKEKLSLCYEGFEGFDPAFTEREAAEKLYALLCEAAPGECAAGISLIGPQRDDIGITVSGKEARIHCSQGQQRSIVLSMKLAEGEISAERTGEIPVYLFDDVLSELDERRQEYLVTAIKGAQVILTTCGKERFSDTAAKAFLVSGGEIIEQ